MRRTTLVFAFASFIAACVQSDAATPVAPQPGDVTLASSGEHGPEHGPAAADGKSIFRFDTFGDETFWTDTLKMHEVIRSSVSPKTALSVGLKVDADALPEAVKKAIASGAVDLDAPATTVTLLKLGAVVGVAGKVDEHGTLQRVGITCAF